MNPTDSKPIGLVVFMPTRGAVSIETALGVREHFDGYPHVLKTAFRQPVGDAPFKRVAGRKRSPAMALPRTWECQRT